MLEESIKKRKINFENDKLRNTRIEYFKEIVKPDELRNEYKITEKIEDFVIKSRNDINNIINRKDNRKLFIVGPCSIHDIDEAKEYAIKLKKIAEMVKDKILIVMRVYFEKPRTTVGWKGLINDPNLDESYDINKGLEIARELLLFINNIGLPCGYEILDTITPQYICDLISWGAIGARTTESQVHRQLVSGLSMAVGFKNGTGGTISLATDAIKSASYSHCFMGITDTGDPAICKTKGNKDCHIILRGGKDGPNFDKYNIEKTALSLRNNELQENIMVDCSHGNSNKIYQNQPIILNNIIEQINENKDTPIIGVMIESNLNEGNQKLNNSSKLKKGISITDACINIETTEEIILEAYYNLKYL